VIFSVACQLTRCLLDCLMLLTRREASKEAELLVLRHENAVLRRQARRVRYELADRLWLAALSRLTPRYRCREVFAVTPATLLTWHRRLVAGKWDDTSRRRPGRPSTAAAIRRLVIRIATGNPAWATAASRANLPGSAITPQPPRSGRSCTTPASDQRPGTPGRPGSNS
jgi:putative transposase